jgi:hypothetical protein
MSSRVITHGQLSTTALTLIHTVATGTTTTVVTFVLTNETTNTVTVTVFANMSTTDRRLTKVIIPAGIGKAVAVPLALGSYSQLDSLKLQSSSVDTFNYLLTGRVDNV